MYGNVLQNEELTQFDTPTSRFDTDYIHDNNTSELADEITIKKLSSKVLGDPESFVDLGLSVNWANKNMGDVSGNYFKGIELDDVKEWDSIPMNFGGTQYDPATNALGESYRLPTVSEWKELIDKCDWNWVEIDGVSGYLITGKNGNKIFLPSVGGYWSCTKGESQDFQCVYYLFFNSYDIDLVYNVFTILRCVRPVQTK